MSKELPNKAIGWKDELSEEELAGKHVDGLTGAVFDTESDYLTHVSPVTGVKPTQSEHLGEIFGRISENALKRGAKRQKDKAEKPAK